MKLTSIDNIKNILRDKPLKKLGQNFLINEEVIEKLISAAEINDGDKILEIGPGVGALTEKLTEKATVIAVEKDSRLIDHLKEMESKSLTVLRADFLNVSLEKYLQSNYKVVSNLPFNVATPIIRKLLKENPPSLIVVIVQKEVAQRIESKGEKENFLSTIIKFRGEPEIVSTIPKNNFWPSPEVDASILKITPHSKYSKKEEEFSNLFFKVVEAGFLHPRKQIKNNLTGLNNFSKENIENILINLNIDPKKRGEDLNLDDWIRITDKYLTLNKKENKII